MHGGVSLLQGIDCCCTVVAMTMKYLKSETKDLKSETQDLKNETQDLKSETQDLKSESVVQVFLDQLSHENYVFEHQRGHIFWHQSKKFNKRLPVFLVKRQLLPVIQIVVLLVVPKETGIWKGISTIHQWP